MLVTIAYFCTHCQAEEPSHAHEKNCRPLRGSVQMQAWAYVCRQAVQPCQEMSHGDGDKDDEKQVIECTVSGLSYRSASTCLSKKSSAASYIAVIAQKR